jgi:anthranilate phosphoribosyltransferase
MTRAASKGLSATEMKSAMQRLMSGQMSDADIESFLLGLRQRGETAVEVAAAAEVMRANAVKLPRSFPDLLDTCGTGGDGLRTLNVSTLSALVAASAGARVAKHGNRSVSSVCGSADLLEKLGVKIERTPAEVAVCLEKTRFGFLFAPLFHPAVKAAMPARKRMGGKTLFNILGPLSNPAGASFQVIGVYEKRLVGLVADALAKLGTQRALVVHGKDGLDEISLSGETYMAELKDGAVTETTVAPEDFNLKRESIESLRCSTPEEAVEAACRVLSGDVNAASKIVCLNAAAALYVSGKAHSIKEGVLQAMDALANGAAAKTLRAVVSCTQGPAK